MPHNRTQTPMRASALEFRLRYLIHGIVFMLGFLSPWDRLLPPDGPLAPTQSTWLSLAAGLSRSGLLSFATATVALLIFGILLAGVAAALRTWASAYLGASIVKDGSMHGRAVVADGPYRHLRNPLYLGTWLHALAVALLMPPTGALFTIIVIAVLQVRLIAGEETFLTANLGAPYLAFCVAVPRLVPSLRPAIPSAGARPHWLQAALGELYMIGVALTFAFAGWRYNAHLLTQGLVVSLGLSLVARAFLPAAHPAERPAPQPGV